MRRITIIYILIIISFMILLIRLFDVQILKHDKYLKILDDLTIKTIETESAPRGRIYDRNYNLLVDNVGVKTIYFKRDKGMSNDDLIKSIKLVKDHIDISFNITDNILKEYYLVLYGDEINKRITSKEKELYKTRKISSTKYNKIKLSKITSNDLKKIDSKEAYLYYLMNKGYYYEEKIIKKYASEEECAYISNNDIKGFKIKILWDRKYIYKDIFRELLGSISDSIPKEDKDYYLSKGYKINDRVGISFLEKQYENILKGEKGVYKLNDDNSLTLVKDSVRGNDIVLTIDINIQKEIEEIMNEEILNAKINDSNTSLYDGSSVIITDPKTGEILAMASKQVVLDNDEYKIYDNSSSLVTTAITPGSIVKGASMSVGYRYNAIDIGNTFYDTCIKIINTPPKCSWKSGIGLIDDIEALMISSNSYQYQTAIRVANASYCYNCPLHVDKEAFYKYRNIFKQYGLGIKTGIDLPIESNGLIGDKYDSGLLLDFSIGQYDTYTPVQISSYISTLANYGNRYKLHLLKEIRNSSNDEKIGTLNKEIKPKLLNKVDLDSKYIDRIRLGFSKVMLSLGYGYMGYTEDPSGKTGTSETFKDTDNDGLIDKETISRAFVGYAPSDNPKFTITVLSPHVYYKEYGESSSGVNYKISERVSNKVFDFLK